MKSIIYWHPAIYQIFKRLLYGWNYSRRNRIIAELVEEGSSVVDVCCGDCQLFSHVASRNVEYVGLDYNERFVESAIKRGIKARLHNLWIDEIPEADFVIIQSSLYQFIPEHSRIIRKLYEAARKYLLICECVDSYSVSKSRVLSYFGKKLNNPGDGYKIHRFTVESLKKALEGFNWNIEKEFFISGRSEYVVLIRKSIAT